VHGIRQLTLCTILYTIIMCSLYMYRDIHCSLHTHNNIINCLFKLWLLLLCMTLLPTFEHVHYNIPICGVCVCVCACVYMYACVYVWESVCVWERVCMHVCECVSSLRYTCRYMYVYTLISLFLAASSLVVFPLFLVGSWWLMPLQRGGGILDGLVSSYVGFTLCSLCEFIRCLP
jgi:hypothetical protein